MTRFESYDLPDDGDLVPLLRQTARQGVNERSDMGDRAPLHWVCRLYAERPEWRDRIDDALAMLLTAEDLFPSRILEQVTKLPVRSFLPRLFDAIAGRCAELAARVDTTRTDNRSLLGSIVNAASTMQKAVRPSRALAHELANMTRQEDGWPETFFLALPGDVTGLLPQADCCEHPDAGDSKACRVKTKLALLPANDAKRLEAEGEIGRGQTLEAKVAELAKNAKDAKDDPKARTQFEQQLETQQKALATCVGKIWDIADPAPLDAVTAKQAIDSRVKDLEDISAPLSTEWVGKTRADFEKKYLDNNSLTKAAIEQYVTKGGDEKTTTTKVGSKDPIAVQKFADIEAEKHLDAPNVGLKVLFYQRVQARMKDDPTYTDRTRTYPVLKEVNSDYTFTAKGVKIPADRISKVACRNQSVGTMAELADKNNASLIDGAIKGELKAKNPRPETVEKASKDPEMRKKAYRHLLKTGTKPLDTINTGGVITGHNTWYGPGSIKLDTSLPPNEQFARMMTLGALQPEWYPHGTIVLKIEHKAEAAARNLIKPTAFDGLMSSLWTSRNLTEADYGITGGGLGEFLEAAVKWADVTEATPVIPEDDFLAEIQRVSSEVSAKTGGASTPTEELLRDNNENAKILNTSGNNTGGAKDTYGSVIDRSTQEQNNPSATSPEAPGAVKPNSAAKPAAPAAAPGGAYDMAGGPRKDVSKNAAGDPPPNWQARVVKKLPSTSVDPADPGHDYHVLDDATGVSTSTAQKLQPAVAEVAAKQANVKPLKDMTPEESLASDEFKEFSKRYGELFTSLKMPVDPDGAKTLWLNVVTIIQKTTPEFANDVKPAPGTTRKNLASEAMQKVIAQFDPIVAALAPAMQKFAEGKKLWAFWSGGDPPMKVAKASSEVCLEKSALGGLFDGININGKWDTQMWASLSKAYAQYAAQDAEKKTYRGFVGVGSAQEHSIFNKIEQPLFVSMLDQKAQANLKITWYAVAVNPANEKEFDPSCSAGGVTGCFKSGNDRGSMVSAAEAVNPKRIDLYKQTLAKDGVGKIVAPDQVDAELAKLEADRAKATQQAAAQQAAAQQQAPAGQQKPAAGAPQQAAGSEQAAPQQAAAPQAQAAPQQAAAPQAQAAPQQAAAPQQGAPQQDAGAQPAQGAEASTPPKPEEKVSKHAAGAPPAGWQANVAKQVPSTEIAPDDPGHTYHLLKDGKGVATSDARLLAEPQVQKLRALPGVSGAQSAAEQDIETFVNTELADLRKLNFAQATGANATSLLTKLGGFEVGFYTMKHAEKYPANEKVIEARKFLSDSRTALEDKADRDITITALAKTGSPKLEPSTYTELERLKPPIERWQAAFVSDHGKSAAGEATCKFALDEIAKVQQKILAHRDGLLMAAAAAITAIDPKKPGDTLASETAKVQVWLDAADLPDAQNLRKKVNDAKQTITTAIASAAEAAKQAPAPDPAKPAPDAAATAQPQAQQAPQAKPDQKAEQKAEQKQADQKQVSQQPSQAQPEANATQPQAAAPKAPDPEQEKKERQKLEREKALVENELQETKLKEAEHALHLKYEETLRPSETMNALSTAGIGVATVIMGAAHVVSGGTLAMITIPVSFGKAIYNVLHKRSLKKDLFSSLPALKLLDAKGLAAVMKAIDEKDFDKACDEVQVQAELAKKMMAEKGKSPTAGALKEEAAPIVVDIGEAVEKLAHHGIEHVIGEVGTAVLGGAGAILGTSLAWRQLRKNMHEAEELRQHLEEGKEIILKLEERLNELDAQLGALGPSAPSAPAPKK